MAKREYVAFGFVLSLAWSAVWVARRLGDVQDMLSLFGWIGNSLRDPWTYAGFGLVALWGVVLKSEIATVLRYPQFHHVAKLFGITDRLEIEYGDFIAVDFKRITHRIRVHNRSTTKTAANVSVRIADIQVVGKSSPPRYVVQSQFDKSLLPKNFDLNPGSKEFVNVATLWTNGEPSIYLCHCDESEMGIDGTESGIEAGRYVLTLQVEAENCTPESRQFRLELSEEDGFLFVPL